MDNPVKKEIYLDNAATTPMSPAALESFAAAAQVYGNPSSLHAAGVRAKRIVSDARAAILRTLGERGDGGARIVFTGTGSEANALALFGTAFAKTRGAKRIIITDSEHPSVENGAKRLEELGFEVIRIPTRGGVLDFGAIPAALDAPVLLASIMLANNETGAIYDVRRAFSMIKEKYPDAVTHTDATQAYLKMPFEPSKLFADLATVSAHKIHGPKGAGALFVSAEMIKTKKILPHTYGGGQEGGLRAGTENVPAIAAFATAAAEQQARIKKNMLHFAKLYEYAEMGLESAGIAINKPAGDFSPHIMSIRLPEIKSQTMLNFLSAEGIYLSSGSACSSNSKKISRTLLAFGLEKSADFTLRASFSPYTATSDIDALCAALVKGLAVLVRVR